MIRTFVLALLLALPAAAQNFLPNGDFEQGATGWTMTVFNDPLGKSGVAVADVTGKGPSQALFTDFQTLTPVMNSRWRSGAFFLPPASVELSFDVMYEKLVTTPIPQPSVNYVEVILFDALNVQVFAGKVQVPNQTGLFERASYKNSFAVPAAGQYTVEVFSRHSNLATIPFTAWVDNIVVGSPTHTMFGVPCAGSGGARPTIGASGTPRLGSNDWKILVSNAFSPTAGVLVLGATNLSWAGVPLPLDIGGSCSVLVAPLFTMARPVLGSGPGQGQGDAPLPIPNDAALRGAMVYGQWWVMDSGSASWTGIATTAGIMFRIQ